LRSRDRGFALQVQVLRRDVLRLAPPAGGAQLPRAAQGREHLRSGESREAGTHDPAPTPQRAGGRVLPGRGERPRHRRGGGRARLPVPVQLNWSAAGAPRRLDGLPAPRASPQAGGPALRLRGPLRPQPLGASPDPPLSTPFSCRFASSSQATFWFRVTAQAGD
jgi:hypothetical protein